MATFKAEVYAHQKKQDGTYNIKIRVTHKGKKKYLATPFFVTASDLTRTLKIKNHRYIDLCDQIIRTYRDKCDDLGVKIDDIDIDELVAYLKERDKTFRLPFIAWCRSCIEKERNDGRRGTSEISRSALLMFCKWLERDEIDINDISRAMASSFVEYLEPKFANATIHSYVGVIAKFFNAAISIYNDTEANVRTNPFSGLKLPRGTFTKKALTIDQIKAIRDAETKTDVETLARDAFMLSFYLIGMNAADLFTCTNPPENGILTYNRKKTAGRRADNAEIQVNIQPEAEPLIEKYKATHDGRVFRFCEMYLDTDAFNSALNYGLRKIGERIGITATFYAARHSWATIAAVNAGVDVYTIHLALNHVSKEYAITETYIKRDFTAINDANRRVLDLFL